MRRVRKSGMQILNGSVFSRVFGWSFGIAIRFEKNV
jgi:hypothetical protein